MNAAAVLIRFSDLVECRVDREGPLGLTLAGREDDGPVQISFVCVAPADWPARLDAPAVVREGPTKFRVTDARANLTLEASNVFIHRDVTHVFEQAIPPRQAPLAKRVFWRAVLALAGTSVGRRMLHALQR